MPSSTAKARLFVEPDLAPGRRLALSPGQAHYVNHVMRLGTGERIALFNGRDGEWAAAISRAGKGAVEVDVGDRVRLQREEPGPWLAFAPIKKARTDFIVEKATELGVSRLLPVITRRTVPSRVNVVRLAATAVEAAEQCGRLTVPRIDEPLTLDQLATDWPSERTLLVLDETGGGRPLAEVLQASYPGNTEGPYPNQGILAGPEGGFEPSELDGFDILPFVIRVGLGPRTLRTETAALSALACWQAILGDGRDSIRP